MKFCLSFLKRFRAGGSGRGRGIERRVEVVLGEVTIKNQFFLIFYFLFFLKRSWGGGWVGVGGVNFF